MMTEEALKLVWVPGRGGLLALLPPSAVPHLEAPSPSATPVHPLHITLLRSRSMEPLEHPLGDDKEHLLGALPVLRAPTLAPTLFRASRPPHPVKDPPGTRTPLKTWFLVPEDPHRLQAVLSAMVACIDDLLRNQTGLRYEHPEPDRFFHVSVFNNRAGDPRRSIGDICKKDLGHGDATA